MHANAHVIRDAVVAIVVGTGIGTTAALWMPREQAARSSPAAASAPAAPAEVPSTRAVTGTAGVQGTPAADTSRIGIPAVRVEDRDAGAPRTAAVAAAAAVPPPSATVAAPQVASARASAPRAADAEIDFNEARTLAQRADVMALIAMRERVAARAQEPGAQQSAAAIKRQLEQLDRYLADARARRLLLDAQEFRKASEKR
jgi:hypothetical protein